MVVAWSGRFVVAVTSSGGVQVDAIVIRPNEEVAIDVVCFQPDSRFMAISRNALKHEKDAPILLLDDGSGIIQGVETVIVNQLQRAP